MFEEKNPKAVNRRYEVQFYGGSKHRTEMRMWLDDLFFDLKKEGILAEYVIRDFY